MESKARSVSILGGLHAEHVSFVKLGRSTGGGFRRRKPRWFILTTDKGSSSTVGRVAVLRTFLSQGSCFFVVTYGRVCGWRW